MQSLAVFRYLVDKLSSEPALRPLVLAILTTIFVLVASRAVTMQLRPLLRSGLGQLLSVPWQHVKAWACRAHAPWWKRKFQPSVEWADAAGSLLLFFSGMCAFLTCAIAFLVYQSSGRYMLLTLCVGHAFVSLCYARGCLVDFSWAIQRVRSRRTDRRP